MMDQRALERLAAGVARAMGPGSRLYLTGDLGTGKSVFARAVLRELGVEGAIPSPSFIVDAVYESRGLEIHHIDLYRLKGSAEELEFYGIDDVLDSRAAVIVEWADRLKGLRLRDGVKVHLDFTPDPGKRVVSIDGRIMAGD
ncbi:MAG: tRNA (adenosine(37)-N6)-threonylcarbamoyltransferase complex ATPase subunit type 1 TsaE [Candidatus Fermentibacteraceae bacterium]|nr:tRNA (adenosine(37)-N6)-threonylcarbamoyltransferase complex ATPase subunit type 1 TsaE [Candidatus Fermentibacteraceae bacterium]MBN2608429.1 tRNA (adenosine(37)-N6)-threonylcarbamoyltransferase complex ATPase subunit type 1 TsaE [Candidatus Fermentibacteraceae bacterium]